jgi:hypothetical protein
MMSQMGATMNCTLASWPGCKPGTKEGPCLAAQRGPPNLFGPLQLWSKPQPGGAAAVFINSQGSTWGNQQEQASTVASFKASEIPGLKQSSSYTVRDVWNHTDLPNANGNITTDPIAPGDSRMYLLTPAK